MEILSTIINGLSLGGIYAMIALGYTMVYGIAKIGCADGHGDILALVYSLLHRAVDRVNAVVSGSAELIERILTELLGVFVDKGLCGALGRLGVEVRKHGDFLGDQRDIEAVDVIDAVKAVTAVVDGVGSDDILALHHEKGCGSIVGGHEDKAAILERIDLGGKVRRVCVGEAGLQNGDGGIKVVLELRIDTVGVSLVGFIENADGLTLVIFVYELSRNLTLVTVGKAHLITVGMNGDIVAGSGGGQEEYVIFRGKIGKFESGCRGYGAERYLHTAFKKRSVVGGELGRVVHIVHGNELELHAVQTAGRVDLVHRHLGRVENGRAVHSGIARQGSGETDDKL